MPNKQLNKVKVFEYSQFSGDFKKRQLFMIGQDLYCVIDGKKSEPFYKVNTEDLTLKSLDKAVLDAIPKAVKSEEDEQLDEVPSIIQPEALKQCGRDLSNCGVFTDGNYLY